MSTTQNTKLIRATPDQVYRAFTDAHALEVWMAPGNMTGKVLHFDLREGGSYEMVLSYPSDDQEALGKSGDREDRYIACFVVLEPGRRIVETIRFDAADARFQGEMTMEVRFEPMGSGTLVSMVFRDIPEGIRPEDNEKGTELSLQKLEAYLGGRLE